MAHKKKLQVFISSTYSDLTQERQAAVEAILTAGHIPAGMELFAAGDESQMNVIKRWIDESDVYLLILGGRYGSIEPKSQKSYIHLEYEYAVERGKPLFAVVIAEDHLEDKVKMFGTKVIETDHPQKLRDFRAMVLNKMVRFWRDPRDIKLAVLETMSELSHHNELVGWIPGNEAVDGGALAEEFARLTKENAALREQVTKSAASSAKYNGLTYEEMYSLLIKSKPEISLLTPNNMETLRDLSKALGDIEPNYLHLLWMLSEVFRKRRFIGNNDGRNSNLARELENLGLIEGTGDNIGTGHFYQLTESSKQFLLRLRLEWNTEIADKYKVQRL